MKNESLNQSKSMVCGPGVRFRVTGVSLAPNLRPREFVDVQFLKDRHHDVFVDRWKANCQIHPTLTASLSKKLFSKNSKRGPCKL